VPQALAGRVAGMKDGGKFPCQYTDSCCAVSPDTFVVDVGHYQSFIIS
jgi:hypothetical protein